MSLSMRIRHLVRMTRDWFLAFVLVAASAQAVPAQETRAGVMEKEQAAKAQAVRPYEPGKIEKILAYIDRTDLFTRLADGDGFYPVVGGITSGGGFAVRGGYRRHFADYRGLFDTSAAISIKGYWQAGFEVAFPELLDRRLEVAGDFKYRSFPQEDFYGIGPDNAEADRVNYSIEGLDSSGLAIFRPRPWFGVGARLGVLSADLGPGSDSRFPSIEQAFTEATAPGLTDQPDFFYREIMAEVDTRDEPGNPRSGGYYRIGWIRYGDREFDRYSFSRLMAEAGQLFPIFDKKRVFLARGRMILSDPDEGSAVPFYLLPTLGGSHTLRSVDNFRFRDNDLLLFNFEYRWEAFSILDMALFFDAGKVVPDHGDVDFGGLKRAYGLGFRFNTHSDVLFRLDLAYGDEGFQLNFNFSGPFRDRAHWPTDTPAPRRRKGL
jgi:hypothetical protein